MAKKKTKTKIEEVIENTIGLLGVSPKDFQIEQTDKAVIVQLDIPEEDSGMFIGFQGETLNSLQLILSLIVSQRQGDWHRVKVNVGDYQERREENILSKADQAANRAVETGQDIILPDLNSYERHLVHDHLDQRSDISTQSRGEGSLRQLFIIPGK